MKFTSTLCPAKSGASRSAISVTDSLSSSRNPPTYRLAYERIYHGWPPRVPPDFRPNHVLFLQGDARAGSMFFRTEFLLYMRWLFSSVAHQIAPCSSSSLCVWENYFKISILILDAATATSPLPNRPTARRLQLYPYNRWFLLAPFIS